jgi:hypothetical protein
MSDGAGGFPERDEGLRRFLGEIEPRRERSEAEWVSLEADIVAAAAPSLARLGWGSLTPVMTWARPMAVAAALAVAVLGGVVYATPRPASPLADVPSELIDLVGDAEVQSYFPGADDPDRLLEAAIAWR